MHIPCSKNLLSEEQFKVEKKDKLMEFCCMTLQKHLHRGRRKLNCEWSVITDIQFLMCNFKFSSLCNSTSRTNWPGNWPFLLLAMPEQKRHVKFIYTPMSDFWLEIRRVPHCILELISHLAQADCWQMMLQHVALPGREMNCGVIQWSNCDYGNLCWCTVVSLSIFGLSAKYIAPKGTVTNKPFTVINKNTECL